MQKLAIDGGQPVRATMLTYGRQSIDAADVAAVSEVLQSDWLTTGPTVTAFENAFAEKVGAKFAVAISNGTSALHAAFFAAGIDENSEIITTPFSFAATANAARYLGAKVVFTDVCQDTLALDPSKIEAQITKKTKAIVPVDYAGHPAELDAIKTIANRYQLIVIEDAAHSLGATYKTVPVGSIADLTTFSFHPVKHITTAEGGMITTNNSQLAERMRLFRNHGIAIDARKREKTGSWIYDMEALGYNYRLSDLQCALGLSQLRKLDGWVARRREIANKYTQAFNANPAIETPTILAECEPSWHLYVIKLNLALLSVDREHIFKALRAENIGVNVHYIPIPWFSYYQSLGYQKGSWPVAETSYETILSLPMWPGMTETDVQDTICAVNKVITTYLR